MPVELKNVDAQLTIPVRNQVLRIGQPAENCWFDGDMLTSSRHYGLYLDKNIIGVVSAYQTKSNYFIDDNQYQLRGMAILDAFQKKRFGEQLIIFAEKELSFLNCSLLWFNARTSAVGFYKNMNYTPVGETFNIKDVGEHLVMFKNLMA